MSDTVVTFDPELRKKRLQQVGAVVLIAVGILARSRLDFVSHDMSYSFVPWYDQIAKHGILTALAQAFSNYSPPYTYLLALATLAPMPKVTAIKLIGVSMDFVNALLVFKLVRLKHPSGPVPLLAAGVFLCLPTVVINSAVWGQVDGVYTGFMLMALYFLLKEMPARGLLAYSVSFAFKAQALFMAPMLAVMFFRRRIKTWHLFLAPLAYVVLSLPVILLGRDWRDVLSIYFQQGMYYRFLSAYAPNFYVFIHWRWYEPVVWIGSACAVAGIAAWIARTVKDRVPLDRERIAFLALISVAHVPFLLPKMHERYFYPADVLSLVVAFLTPELWFVPIAYQAISGLSYTPNLLGWSAATSGFGALMNAAVILFLLGRQFGIPGGRIFPSRQY